MNNKLNLFYQLLKQQGPKYVLFRIRVLLEKKIGIFKRKYKTTYPDLNILKYKEWLENKPPFLIEDRNDLKIDIASQDITNGKRILAGELPYFSWQWFQHNDNTWLTNPLSGYTYKLQHFSEIPEFVEAHGDIKYLWEASRFSWLYDIMLYDLATDENNDAFVFSKIESWIDHNPLNLGPNYICSQEIALRVLNWLYALHFYANSPLLTSGLWQKIVLSIVGQMDHVYKNRRFALIAVRNNHTLTEMLSLYVVGKLFSFLPEADHWASTGKKHFEQEVAYQIDEDGSYIQQSFNYQRVVIQLLSWALKLGELWDDQFSPVTYNRAKACLHFMQSFCQPENGFLPNYGANDGALFFRFNTTEYRDFRPQLNGLSTVLGQPNLNGNSDASWYGSTDPTNKKFSPTDGSTAFEDGGYYLLKNQKLFGFIRYNDNKHRPSHADNLHLDLWHRGENVLMDGGSFLYNTKAEDVRYFFGAQSHNTVTLDLYEQMEKGPRFVWLNWTKKINARVIQSAEEESFEGEIEGFSQVGPNIHHKRLVNMTSNQVFVTDNLQNKPEHLKTSQGWLLNSAWLKKVEITSTDEDGRLIEPITKEGWISHYYGQKTTCKRIVFATQSNKIITKFTFKH